LRDLLGFDNIEDGSADKAANMAGVAGAPRAAVAGEGVGVDEEQKKDMFVQR